MQVQASKTSVSFYQTRWRYNPGDNHFIFATVRTSNRTKSPKVRNDYDEKIRLKMISRS